MERRRNGVNDIELMEYAERRRIEVRRRDRFVKALEAAIEEE